MLFQFVLRPANSLGHIQQCAMCDQQSLRSACAYAQSDQSLKSCQSLECSMDVKLLTEFYLEFLSLKVGYTGLSESTLVKMPQCWKSHVAAQISNLALRYVLYGLLRIAGQTTGVWGHSGRSISSHKWADTWSPTIWHFDECRLKRASAASF